MISSRVGVKTHTFEVPALHKILFHLLGFTVVAGSLMRMRLPVEPRHFLALAWLVLLQLLAWVLLVSEWLVLCWRLGLRLPEKPLRTAAA